MCFSSLKLTPSSFQLLVFISQAKTKPTSYGFMEISHSISGILLLSNSNWVEGMVSKESLFPGQPCIISAFNTLFTVFQYCKLKIRSRRQHSWSP